VTILAYLAALVVSAVLVALPFVIVSERRVRHGLRSAADSEAAFEGRLLTISISETQLTREVFEAAEARAFDAAAERKAARLRVVDQPDRGSAEAAAAAFRMIRLSLPGDAATAADGRRTA